MHSTTGIYVKFIGEAIVKWTKRRHHKRGGRHGSQEEVIKEFVAREDYFSINRDVIRSDDGKQESIFTISFTFPIISSTISFIATWRATHNDKEQSVSHRY